MKINKNIIIILIMILLSLSLVSAVPTGGICSYNFDSVTDTWGSNNAVNSGATSSIDYPVYSISGNSTASSFSFDGSNDYLTISEPFALDNADLSISFRFKTSDSSGISWLIQNRDSGDASDVFAIETNRETGKLGILLRSDTTISSTTTVTDGAWHHAVITRNQTSGLTKLYLDNSLEDSGTITGTIEKGLDWIIGGYPSGSSLFYNGLMDDVRVYDIVLSSEQVEDEYQTGTIEVASNNAPTIPTLISGLPSHLFVGDTLDVTGSGSTDADNDTITYYYEFYDQTSASILQSYSTNNTYLVLSAQNSNTIEIRVKAFDGSDYSSVLTTTDIVEFIAQEVTDNNGFLFPNSANQPANTTQGMIMEANKNITLLGVFKDSSDTSTQALLYNSTNILLDTASFVGDEATFDYNFTTGELFKVVTTNPIASLDRSYTNDSPGYIVSGTNVDFITGIGSSINQNSTYGFSITGIKSIEQGGLEIVTSVNILNITANDILFVDNTDFNDTNNIEFNVTYEVLNSPTGNYTNSSIINIINGDYGTYNTVFEVCYNVTTCVSSSNYTYNIFYIPNTAPTTPTTLTGLPTNLYVGDTLTMTASGSTDADNDTITYYYEFYDTTDSVTLQAYSTTNTYTILSSELNQNITVRVKAYDGVTYSIEKEVTDIVEDNSTPSLYSTLLVFNDTFTDTNGVLQDNHIPDLGDGWTKVFGNLLHGDMNHTINDGTVKTTNTSYYVSDILFYDDNGVMYITTEEIDNSNYEVFLKGSNFGGSSEISSIVARYQDTDNYYVYSFSTSSSSYDGLMKVVNGNKVNLNTTCALPSSTSLLSLKVEDNQISVYKDGILSCSAIDNSLTLPGHAGMGTGKIPNWELGQLTVDQSYTDFYVKSNNQIPVMISSEISPSEAYTNNNINGYCNSSDSDTSLLKYYYKWYNGTNVYSSSNTSRIYTESDNVLISTINNITTSKDENWIFSCMSNDGLSNSSWINSSSVNILNSIPVINEVNLFPLNLQEDDTLIYNYTYIDNDEDIISDFKINWYKDSVEQLSLANLTNITSGNLSLGDNWIMELQIFDGLEWSNIINSSSRTVNLVESPEIISLIPTEGESGSQLTISVKLLDDTNVTNTNITLTDPDNLVVMNNLPMTYVESVINNDTTFNTTYSKVYTPTKSGEYIISLITAKDEFNNTMYSTDAGKIIVSNVESSSSGGGSGSGSVIIPVDAEENCQISVDPNIIKFSSTGIKKVTIFNGGTRSYEPSFSFEGDIKEYLSVTNVITLLPGKGSEFGIEYDSLEFIEGESVLVLNDQECGEIEIFIKAEELLEPIDIIDTLFSENTLSELISEPVFSFEQDGLRNKTPFFTIGVIFVIGILLSALMLWKPISISYKSEKYGRSILWSLFVLLIGAIITIFIVTLLRLI